jgi:hypothetical protein
MFAMKVSLNGDAAMLIDPPKYVNVPVELIYYADDPDGELYRAALQIMGWMWVTKRSGRPLLTSTAELAQRWGVARRTAYARLQRLAERGYIRVSHVDGQVQIWPGARQAQHTDTPGDMVTHTDTQAEPATRAGLLHEMQAGGTNRAGVLHERASRRDTNNVVVVDPSREPGQQQQLLLVAAGTFTDVAARLAADPWVTAERIEGWIDALRADPAIRNLPACLAANLAAHREPPPTAEECEERNGRRYIDGPYAEYIRH